MLRSLIGGILGGGGIPEFEKAVRVVWPHTGEGVLLSRWGNDVQVQENKFVF